MNDSASARGSGLLIGLVILCWAYSPIGIHTALAAYSPGHLALARFVVASLLMGCIAMVVRIPLPRLSDLPMIFVLGFFAITLHHVTLNFGQRWVSASAASVLAQSTPIFSVLIGVIFLQEKLGLRRLLCVSLGIAGALLVVWGDQSVGSHDARGLWILVAAASWSIYFTLQKHYSKRYRPLPLVCYSIWAGTLMLSVYSPGLMDAVSQAPLQSNLAVLTLGVFPSALAYIAWARVLSNAQVSHVSMYLYLIPPTAMFMAAIFLDERISMTVILGAGMVIGSLTAMGHTPRKDKTPTCSRR